MKRAIIFLSLIVILMVGCKPTENNYRIAYETAQSKRDKAIADAGGHQLQLDSRFMKKAVGGDSIWVSHEMLEGVSLEGDSVAEQNMHRKNGVAVGLFRMKTNAKAMAERMRKEYPDACLATDGRERWFTVLGLYPEVEAGIEALRKFEKSHSGFRYVGLPESPVLIRIY